MEEQQIEKAVKTGSIIAIVIGFITLVMVFIAISTGSAQLAFLNDPLNYVDAAIYLVLGFFIYRRSRFASVFTFLFYIISKIILFKETGSYTQIIVGLVISYFFWKAMMATIAHHKNQKAKCSELKPSRKWTFWLKVPIGGISTILFVYILAVTLGFLPDYKVKSGDEISSDNWAFFHENNIVGKYEQIALFYSAGLFSIKEDGNILTNERVISYEEWNGKLEIYQAAYEEIKDIELTVKGSSLEDSQITIFMENGDSFLVLVPTDAKSDEIFMSRIRQYMINSAPK